ncbi:MAG: patatin-like phospholipase family protein, partial [Gammaproteobacteria bacterium]
FPILVGTSAGAIVAAALASGAEDFSGATRRLEGFWRHFTSGRVYRTDSLVALRAVGQMFVALLSAGRLAQAPSALLDTRPLRVVLETQINFERMRLAMAQGALAALAITATDLLSGDSVSFYEATGALPEWRRAWRRGQPVRLSIDHLMASSAMPLLFPGVPVEGGVFGDGGVRQLAPLSPAVHLGADRVLAISVRENRALRVPAVPPRAGSVSPAQIFGLALDTLFLDTLESDLERLTRMNEVLAGDGGCAPGYRRIDALVLRPSASITAIAAGLTELLPRSTRSLLRLLGAGRGDGGRLASYLLFESAFTLALVELGRKDAHDNSRAIRALVLGEPVGA